jgi:hypothetical protein
MRRVGLFARAARAVVCACGAGLFTYGARGCVILAEDWISQKERSTYAAHTNTASISSANVNNANVAHTTSLNNASTVHTSSTDVINADATTSTAHTTHVASAIDAHTTHTTYVSITTRAARIAIARDPKEAANLPNRCLRNRLGAASRGDNPATHH